MKLLFALLLAPLAFSQTTPVPLPLCSPTQTQPCLLLPDDYAKFSTTIPIKGDPGPKGDPGLPGASVIGPIGQTGATGRTGAQGLQGIPGPNLDRRVNVLAPAFGCKANDQTDDLACFNSAVTAAKSMNLYGGSYAGSTVYFPSGHYKFSRHFVLPRNGNLPGSSTNGVVNIVCEDESTTILDFSGDTTDLEAITWDQTPQRVTNQVIKDCTIVQPSTFGSYAIHHSYTAANRPGCPASGVINAALYPQACYAERVENPVFENLYFIANSNLNKASVYIEGDTIGQSYRNWSQRVTQPNGVFNTILLLADNCYFGGAEATEACGVNLGSIDNIGSGTTGGGGSSVFQGRAGQVHWNTSFCDGAFGGSQNAYCYLFVNAAGNVFSGLFNEGNGGVQIRCDNCHLNEWHTWGLGSPVQADGVNDGMQLNNSSGNQFYNEAANSYSGGDWATRAPGFVRLRMTNSHNNRFYNFQVTGAFANEVVADDLITNYFEWCDATGNTANANCRNGPMGSIGQRP